jgi:hypothetical protein
VSACTHARRHTHAPDTARSAHGGAAARRLEMIATDKQSHDTTMLDSLTTRVIQADRTIDVREQARRRAADVLKRLRVYARRS